MQDGDAVETQLKAHLETICGQGSEPAHREPRLDDATGCGEAMSAAKLLCSIGERKQGTVWHVKIHSPTQCAVGESQGLSQ